MNNGRPSRIRRTRRATVGWVAAWAGLVTTGTALHWGTWIAPAADPPVATFLGAGIFKPLGNLMTLPAAPGWILETVVAAKVLSMNLWETGHSVLGAAIANGIGWAVCLALLAWLLRARRWLAGVAPAPGPDACRRSFLVNGAFAGATLGGGATLVHAATVAPWDLRVTRYRVPIDDLPAGLEGLRIVQIADTHLGPRVPADYLHRVMARALDLSPDVLAFTGDYVHNGFYQIAPAAELFSRYIYDYIPAVGVLGNHDWYAGGKASSAALSRIGIRMIDNTRVFLDAATRRVSAEATPDCLCLAGLGDLQQDHIDPASALDGVPPGVPRIVLAHNPDTAEEPAMLAPAGGPRRIDLMLCGHTHGGQVRLPLIGAPIVPSRFGNRYAHGLAQGPVCRVLTSAGVGLALIPVRFNVPPELVEITLVRA